MTLNLLKNTVGGTFIISHFIAIFIAYIFLSSEMNAQDFYTVILIITPVLGFYGIAFYRDILRNKHNPHSDDLKSVRPIVFFTTVPIVFIMSGFVIYTIFNFSGSGDGPDELKFKLAAVEAFAGGFIALMFEEVFGVRRSNDDQS